MDKKILGIFTVALVFFIVFISVGRNADKEDFNDLVINDQEEENQQEEDQIIGGDKDEHGCLIAAGYSWCEEKEKCLRPWEEGCGDYIIQLFEVIKEKTGIAFSEVENTTLSWNVESEEGAEDLSLTGFLISSKEVSVEDFQELKNIVEKEGFETDELNATGGVMGEFDAYRKDGLSMVCTLSGIFSDFDPEDTGYEPQTTDKDVEITCAILEKSLLPEISVEKRIKEAFAQKYDKKVSQIEVSLEKEDGNYARGLVKILPEYLENKIFLAAKVNGQWEIAYIENEIPCKNLENYGFPTDIREGICAAIQENEL